MRKIVEEIAADAKGFLHEAEAAKLYTLATQCAPKAPCLEIGSYCGKSTLHLAEGCRISGGHRLFAVDHHRGSPEQQPGEEHFDPELYDDATETVDTFPHFMENLRRAELVNWVIPVVTESHRLSQYLQVCPLSLLFIDGNHAHLDVYEDFLYWGNQVITGGYVCIHDVFPDATYDGSGPWQVFEFARITNRWEQVDLIESLGILRRI